MEQFGAIGYRQGNLPATRRFSILKDLLKRSEPFRRLGQSIGDLTHVEMTKLQVRAQPEIPNGVTQIRRSWRKIVVDHSNHLVKTSDIASRPRIVPEEDMSRTQRTARPNAFVPNPNMATFQAYVSGRAYAVSHVGQFSYTQDRMPFLRRAGLGGCPGVISDPQVMAMMEKT